MAENVELENPQNVTPAPGSAGVESQVPGQASTVSGLANATGGVDGGNLVQPDIDQDLFEFKSDDTPLMQLMLSAKKVPIDSAEVDHYMIDEERATVETNSAVEADTSNNAFSLPLKSDDKLLPREQQTIMVCGVDGYDETGANTTPGKNLMLIVTGRDSYNNPICRAVNGPKTTPSGMCTVPAIPSGTELKLLPNALYETQKEVEPDLIVPQPIRLYAQKRGLNHIVSDYFDAQKKRIPFAQAVVAEAQIAKFKREGNRGLWASVMGKMAINVPKLGQQYIYTMEGVRWQFKRLFDHTGSWTFEDLIALAKLFYTGEDVPTRAIWLMGKNLLENIQCIDFSKHPEVTIRELVNEKLGWAVTRIHTVFGDIDLKREPTLDTLGWSNSGALIGENRLVHYTYSTEHEFSDRVEGEEATRKGVLVWDCLGLKGNCHIWVNGEAERGHADIVYTTWGSGETPLYTEVEEGMIYYFTKQTTLVAEVKSGDTVVTPAVVAEVGTLWTVEIDETDNSLTWTEYSGVVSAGD